MLRSTTITHRHETVPPLLHLLCRPSIVRTFPMSPCPLTFAHLLFFSCFCFSFRFVLLLFLFIFFMLFMLLIVAFIICSFFHFSFLFKSVSQFVFFVLCFSIFQFFFISFISFFVSILISSFHFSNNSFSCFSFLSCTPFFVHPFSFRFLAVVFNLPRLSKSISHRKKHSKIKQVSGPFFLVFGLPVSLFPFVSFLCWPCFCFFFFILSFHCRFFCLFCFFVFSIFFFNISLHYFPFCFSHSFFLFQFSFFFSRLFSVFFFFIFLFMCLSICFSFHLFPSMSSFPSIFLVNSYFLFAFFSFHCPFLKVFALSFRCFIFPFCLHFLFFIFLSNFSILFHSYASPKMNEYLEVAMPLLLDNILCFSL